MRHLVDEMIVKPLGTSLVLLLVVCAVGQAASPPVRPALREAGEGHLSPLAHRDPGAVPAAGGRSAIASICTRR